MYRRGKLQTMKVKFECTPDEVVRLKCLGKLFNEFGFEADQVADYIAEAEHQDGSRYWAMHFLANNDIDYGKLVDDMKTYLEVTNADTG